jgi:flagellar hook assembly protein FlgD
VVPNFQVRIGDVIGTFQPSGQAIVPVDTGGNNITTDAAYYLRSSITQIRENESAGAFNYPNPFNPRNQVTNIVFYSTSSGQSKVKIFTITGQLVRTLEHNAAAGSNEVVWDGKNGRGQVVRNGVYVAVILPPGGSKQMVKIAVVK